MAYYIPQENTLATILFHFCTILSIQYR